jgi:tagatose 1,6-diphosphate aldolase
MRRNKNMRITRGKFTRLNACANEQGIIAALAVDHRGPLQQALTNARGGQATVEDMVVFKTAVTKTLTPYASAILLDPEYGLGVIDSRADHTGVMLAYEQSGYDINVAGRLPDLLPGWSARRLIEAGAQAIKILLYYNPDDKEEIKQIKQAYVERIGAECSALDVPLFLEPLVYDETLEDEKGLAFARKKPAYVVRAMEEFSQPRYCVDVLKVELPINPAFVAGTRAFRNEGTACTRQEALQYFRDAAQATGKPFIYLSAGVTDEVFCEMLELAAEAGAKFSGVLCGRATWQDGIAAYGHGGVPALEHWLQDRGVRNIKAINEVLEGAAAPWWEAYGGKDKIEVVDMP